MRPEILTSNVNLGRRLVIIEMEITKGFYDLCVPWQKDEKDLVATLNELYDGKY